MMSRRCALSRSGRSTPVHIRVRVNLVQMFTGAGVTSRRAPARIYL